MMFLDARTLWMNDEWDYDGHSAIVRHPVSFLVPRPSSVVATGRTSQY